jgi:hypothetical protein
MTSRFLLRDIPQFFSVVLHPLLMPLFGLFILFNSGTYFSFLPPEFKRSVFLIVGICTLAMPLIFIPFFLYRKIITNIEMNSAQERAVPLIITFALYLLAYYLMRSSAVPKALQIFLLGATLCVLANLFINLAWKISAHMIGLGGIVGLIISLSLTLHSNVIGYLVLFLFLSGLAGTARLLLNSHSPAQIYTGFAVGFSVMFFTLFIF